MKLMDFNTEWRGDKEARLAAVLDQMGFEREAMRIADTKFWGEPHEDDYYGEDTLVAIEDELRYRVKEEIEEFWRSANPYERCFIDKELEDVDFQEIAFAYGDMYDYQMRNRIFDNAPRAAEYARRYGA